MKWLLLILCVLSAVSLRTVGELAIENGGASNVTRLAATVYGTLSGTNGTNPVVTLFYGESDGYTNATSWSYSNLWGVAEAGEVSTNLSGLTPATKYFYRWYAAENPSNSAWAPASDFFYTLAGAPTSLPAVAAHAVMVDTNGAITSPTNFAEVNNLWPVTSRSNGVVDLGGEVVTNATYCGDGSGLTNVPPTGFEESDPVWSASSNQVMTTLDAISTQVWTTSQYPQAILPDGSRDFTNPVTISVPVSCTDDAAAILTILDNGLHATNRAAVYIQGGGQSIYATANAGDGAYAAEVVNNDCGNCLLLGSFEGDALTLNAHSGGRALWVFSGNVDLGGNTVTNGSYAGDGPGLTNLTLAAYAGTNLSWDGAKLNATAPTAPSSDNGVHRYTAVGTSGQEVLVAASSNGVSAVWGGSTVTITIPAGVVLHSVRIRWPGTSGTTITIVTGTNDMGNVSLATRWMPVCQAWREDNGSVLPTVSATMDTVDHSRFMIQGLDNAHVNHIRLDF